MSDIHDLAATAHEHDLVTRSGSVLLDDGRVLHYGTAAFDAGGLRMLRPGQRVRVRLDGPLDDDGVSVLVVTLSTFAL